MSKNILYHFYCPPQASSTFKEGLDAALVSATFEQKVALLFSQEAVWALIKNQTQQMDFPKIHTPALGALELYGITQIFIDITSLNQRNLSTEKLMIQPTLLTNIQTQELIGKQDIIVGYP